MSELFGFLFVELAEGKEVEVLRVGEFVDMHGKEVTISAEDLDTFVTNFEAGASGQDVPIDVDHERKEAAGWIKALSRAGDKLVAVPDWNELGKKLVGEKVYRYLSATIDLASKVIKSVSLVNFPAVKGLQPVELSEGVYTMKMDGLLERIIAAVMAAFKGGEEEVIEEGTEEAPDETSGLSKGGGDDLSDDQDQDLEVNRMDPKKEAELREKLREEILADMAKEQSTRAELKEEIRSEVEAEFKAELTATYERRKELVEFAAEVCGGEAGLSEKPEDVVAFLESVPEDQVELAQRMLKAKVVEFGERGSTGAGNDKKKLDGPYATQLRAWQQKGQSVAEFFELNEDILGQADEYDLSEFEKKED